MTSEQTVLHLLVNNILRLSPDSIFFAWKYYKQLLGLLIQHGLPTCTIRK
jgi:hypothetical protein